MNGLAGGHAGRGGGVMHGLLGLSGVVGPLACVQHSHLHNVLTILSVLDAVSVSLLYKGKKEEAMGTTHG